MSNVDKYLEKRQKRRQEEEETTASKATQKAKGISGKSKTVKNYLNEYEEEGRYRRDAVARNSEGWASTKKSLGVNSFKPSERTMEFAREYAAQAAATKQKKQLQNMVDEYKQRVGNKTQTISPMTVLPRAMNPYYEELDLTLESARKDPDFTKYVEKGSKDIISGYSDDLLGKIRTTAKSLNPNVGLRARHLTDEEKEMYNYILGKYGRSEADDFEESLSPQTNQRMTEEISAETRDYSKKHPVKAVGLNAIASIQSGEGYLKALATEFANQIAQGANSFKRGYDEGLTAALSREKEESREQSQRQITLDPNDEAFLGYAQEEASRKGIKDRVHDTFGESATVDSAVDIGLAVTQNIARLPFGDAGLAVAAGGAATGGYKSALERGGTNEQALGLGAAQGAAEAFFEKYSLEGLKELQAVPVKAARDVFKNLLKQGFTEGQEEILTEFANTMTDEMIMKELSEFEINRQNYINMGLSEEEAALKANQDFFKQLGLAGVGGAISGGVMGGGAMALGQISQNMENRQKNQLIIDPLDPTTGGRREDVANMEFAREYKKYLAGELENNAQEPSYLPQNQQQNIQTEESLPSEENVAKTARELSKEIFASFGENGAKAASENYDPNLEMLDYNRAFGKYYDAGRHNNTMQAAENSPITSILTKEQAQAAYDAGLADFKLEQSQMVEYKQGAKKEGIFENQSKNATKAQAKFLERVGTHTGLKVVLVDDMDGVNASYESGTITISANSKNLMGTTSHELTHFIRENAPKDYEMYRDLCINYMMESKNVSLDRLIETYQRAYTEQGQNLTRDQIKEEIVADATTDFFNDEEFIKKVAKKDRTIAEKIIDFLNDVIDAMKELLSTTSRLSSAAIKENLQHYESARDVWMDALETASESYKNGKELVQKKETRYQLANPDLVNEEQIESNFETVRNMKPVAELTGKEFEGKRGAKYLTEEVTEYYNSLGNVVHNDVVGDILLTRRSVKDDTAHGYNDLKAIAFKAVPEVLKNGKVLQYTKDWKGRGYDSVIIGAQIKVVSGELKGNYYQLCIANVNKENNRMYLHEVQVIEKAGTSRSTRAIAKSDPPSGYVPLSTNGDNPFKTWAAQGGLPSGDVPFIYSIFDKLNGVNRTSEKRRFQLKDPVEETKDLIAVHNVSSEKLLKTLELEGLPMPSIAVTKAELGHEGFGDISLLFKKETIDPKKKKNKVYSADAWTPTFPQVEYETSSEVTWNLRKKVNEASLPEEYSRRAGMVINSLGDYLSASGSEEGVVNRLKDETAMKALYLAEQGETVEEVKKEVREEKKKNTVCEAVLSTVEESPAELVKMPLKTLYEKYAKDLRVALIKAGKTEEEATRMTKKGGLFGFDKLIQRAVRYAEKPDVEVKTVTDYEAMQKTIEERIDPAEYETWLRKNISGLMKGSGIPNGKELFTKSGERKSFSQTHLPLTAKNVVKAMLSQGTKNTSGFTAGVKSLRAAVSEEFKSIEDIKKNSNRLVTTEEYQAAQDELSLRLEKVMKEIQNQKKSQSNEFIDFDTLGNVIIEASENPTAEHIKATLENYGRIVTNEQAQELSNIIQDTKEMPVNMFEAKPQRVVDYSEIAAAVVPENEEAAADALMEKGVKVVLYDKNKNGARKEAVNTVEGIRFQLQDIEEYYSYSDVETIVKTNDKLQKANEKLKEQLILTKDYKPRKEDISKYAGEILKTYNSSYSKKTLSENLSKLYEYMGNTKKLDMDEMAKAAASIGHAVLNKAKPMDAEDAAYNKKLLETIRKTTIKVPREVRAELMSEGGYGVFRQKYFRKLTLNDKGITIDAAYEQLKSQFPEQFDAGILNPADQLFKIAEVVDNAQPKIENPYGAHIDDLSVVLGQEMLDHFGNIRNLPPTVADKLFEKAKKEEIKYLEARKEYEEEIDSYKKVLLERANTKSIKKQIIRDVTRMQTWLTKPTDKEHVPEKLRTAAAEFLSYIDYSTNYKNQFGEETKRTLAWQSVQNTYAAILASGNMVGEGENAKYVELDPDLANNIEALIEKVKGIDRLDDLGYSDLITLRNTVASMKKTIQDVDFLYGNDRYETAGKAAKQSAMEMGTRKQKWTPDAAKMADRILNTDMLDSITFFERMGPAAESMFQEIRKGFNKKISLTKVTADYFENLKTENKLTAKQMREWSEDIREFKPTGGGDTLKLSVTQIMSLYELTKRPQAKKHIWGEGARGIRTRGNEEIREVKIGNKTVAKVKGATSITPVKFSANEVSEIVNTLTPEQKAVADGIGKFFVDYTGKWGNEVSMLMYSYKKFNDTNYFPISVDRNELATNSESLQQTRTLIKNLGMTKSTVKDAKNAIIIDDIFEVFAKHADQMASYNAFVPALSDFHKFYNYTDEEFKGLKEKIEVYFGKDGNAYIEDFLIDVNGGMGGESDPTAGLLRNVKAAAVGANIRTIIQQPTAYMRAMMEIDPKYLGQGLKKAPEGSWEECKEYCAIAQWKDWGFFDVNTGKSMRSILLGSDSLREKVIEWSMAGAGKADEIAWTHLWLAVKAETSDLHPELIGEAYLKACGDRMSEVIDRTQVVDSVFHRSRAMKKKGWDLYTAFMSEPMKSYNVLYRAVDQLNQSKYQNGGKATKEAKTYFYRATAVYAMTGTLTAVAAAVWDTARDDDDEKRLWEKYIENLLTNLADNLNPLNMIPVAKDIFSIFSGYSSNRMDLQAVQQLTYSITELGNYIAGESKYNFAGLMQKWLRPISMLTGIPVANLIKDVNASINLIFAINEEVFGAEWAHTADYLKDRITLPVGNQKNLSQYTKKALKAYSMGKKTTGDRILKDLRKAGIEKEDIDAKVKSIIKESPEVEEAAKFFMDGKLKEYAEKVEEISKIGVDKELIIKAVQSKVDKLSGNEEGEKKTKEEIEKEIEEEEKEEKEEPSLYRTKDITYALDSGNTKNAQEIATYLYKAKRESGRTANEARKDIKTALSGQYKKRFLALDPKTEEGHEARRQIRQNLERITLDGTAIFAEADFTKWIDDDREEKKK